LLIHLNEQKTEQKFDKRRRNFDQLAYFIRYDFGNVVCRPVVVTNEGSQITVTNIFVTIPIYFTKYISRDINSIPIAYKKALTT
jgi:ABC-type microcin C transport system permease subunit YejB